MKDSAIWLVFPACLNDLSHYDDVFTPFIGSENTLSQGSLAKPFNANYTIHEGLIKLVVDWEEPQLIH